MQINKVYEYVFLNIGEGIKLKEEAGLVNMAPGSFCRYFKKKTNLIFMEYVKKVRIGLAAKMLVETDKSAENVCVTGTDEFRQEKAYLFSPEFQAFTVLLPE